MLLEDLMGNQQKIDTFLYCAMMQLKKCSYFTEFLEKELGRQQECIQKFKK